MKLTPLLRLSAAIPALAGYFCPAAPAMIDAMAIGFGYTIQALLEGYYQSVPINASFFSDLPISSMATSNGMALAEKTVTNVEGLGTQASLGAKALMEIGGMLGLTPPPCTFTFPASNGTDHLMDAFYFEAALCGEFIGLADYYQSAELNSLSARLAAEHGIHAAGIRSMVQPVGFMPNSKTLTPAFTPEMILQLGMDVGMLGMYLSGRVSTPPAPCGGTVSFGPLLPTSSGASSMGSNSTASMPAGNGGAMLSTSTPMPFNPTSPNSGPSMKAAVGVGLVAAILTLLLV